MKYTEMRDKLFNAGLAYPIPKQFNIKLYLEAGVIAKEQLEDGQYYFGLCRNTKIAVWDKPKNVFHHLRLKFGHWFMEDINHIEDDNGFDMFVPFEKIDK